MQTVAATLTQLCFDDLDGARTPRQTGNLSGRSEEGALRGLPAKQERLGIPPLAADLEGSEVFVPIAIRHFRFGLDPKP
jgi:hypothetical protein